MKLHDEGDTDEKLQITMQRGNNAVYCQIVIREVQEAQACLRWTHHLVCKQAGREQGFS